MISAVNLHKRFGAVHVLKGVSLHIEKGEVISLVGASGAGKTTLLQILGTLDKSDEGALIIDKKNIASLNDKQLSRFRNTHIGFIFQFHHLLPEFTALENVCMPGFIGNNNQKETINKATGLLEFLGLKERLSHKPAALSGGEQQRVAAARALINNPSVVLADEPSGNLDSVASKELHKLFFQLRDHFNQTFLIATHNSELAHMADRKIEIKDGIVNT